MLCLTINILCGSVKTILIKCFQKITESWYNLKMAFKIITTTVLLDPRHTLLFSRQLHEIQLMFFIAHMIYLMVKLYKATQFSLIQLKQI